MTLASGRWLGPDDELSKQRKPFFALILTSGNHRPYTVPKETHGYAREILSDDDLHKNGFEKSEMVVRLFAKCRITDARRRRA